MDLTSLGRNSLRHSNRLGRKNTEMLKEVVLVLNFAIYCRSLIDPNRKVSPSVSSDKNEFFITLVPYIGNFALIIQSLLYISYLQSDKGSDLEYFTVLEALTITMAMLASLFRIWAMLTLGRFFSFKLNVQPGHQLITSGPYSYLCHPSYTGMVLNNIFLTAFFLIGNIRMENCNNLVAVVFFVIYVRLTAIPTINRIQKEEKMLRGKFGEVWDEFCASRYKLLPGIW